MQWLSENWVWVLIGIAFIAFHMFGHGGHGGHGGHRGDDGRGGDRKPGRDTAERSDADAPPAHRH